jgi:hypothetical protein
MSIIRMMPATTPPRAINAGLDIFDASSAAAAAL